MATRISVIVPCFNAESFLRKAVESLRATQYPNLEILLFDDGSTDASLNVAHRLAGEQEGIRVFTHPDRVNRGAGVTRNVAVTKSSGEYLAFLDADDYVQPARFVISAKILDENIDIDAVCGATERVIEPGGEERGKHVRPRTVFDCDDPDRVLEYRLFNGLAWSTNAILVRRTVFERAGGFSARRTGQDAVLWLKLGCIARIASAGPDPIAIYRIHAANASSVFLHRPRFVPLTSCVISEALGWARTAGVRKDRVDLLLKALVDRTLLDNRRLREDRQFFGALVHLGRLVVHHPALLSRSVLWRGIGCTLLEGLRLRKPAFAKTETET